MNEHGVHKLLRNTQELLFTLWGNGVKVPTTELIVAAIVGSGIYKTRHVQWLYVWVNRGPVPQVSAGVETLYDRHRAAKLHLTYARGE